VRAQGAGPLVRDGKSSSSRAGPGVSNKVGDAPNLLHGKSPSIFAPQPVVTDSQVNMAPDYDRVIRRYELQAAARELLPREGVANCMRGIVPKPGASYQVDVIYAPIKGQAHYGGLQTCRSVWHCPVCAAKISERRREELSTALRIWSEEWKSEQHRLLLVTFTLQHNASDDLSIVLKALIRSRGLMVSGRGAKYLSETYGVVGMIRALEVTYGVSGWHPHLHVLMFFSQEVPIIPFEQEMKDRWSKCVTSSGRYASWQHGCDVRFSDADIAAYVTKWGKEPKWTASHEMTKAVTKKGKRGGKTPMQLLSDYSSGDAVAGRLWLQYAVNFRGQRQLYWTPGLRERLGLGKERSDDEIAIEQEEIGILLSSLTFGAWRVIVANDARGELLEVATTGDAEKLQQFLDSLGVGKLSHKGGYNAAR